MKKYLLSISCPFCLLILAGNVQAQQKIKDGTGTPVTALPATGSLLELQSTQAGLRMPQVSLPIPKHGRPCWVPVQQPPRRA